MRARLARLMTLLLLAAACDPGEVVLLAPDKSDDDAPALTIQVVVDTPYVALAMALGWTDGVPGAEVRVHLMEEPYAEEYWHVATADSLGVARFPNILSGLYEVEATRALTGPELVQADSAARILAGGRRMWVSLGTRQPVTTAPDRRGSLVLSEFWLSAPSHWETGGIEYPDAKYFEVYNNADTTIYLDGKYWAIGWHLNRDYSAWPCAQTRGVRNDPEGIWVERVFQFPGGGSDYPLAPGEVALIAKSGIDHRPAHPDLFDLSHADFEWRGYRNADNPDVPNLADIGLRPMVLNWPMPDQPEVLSEPVDLGTLPRYTDPWSGDQWVRIPRDKVLDASAGEYDWGTSTYVPQLPCLEKMHRNFERLPGPAWGDADNFAGVSFQRRVLYVLPDGRKVLQDTDTSMEDFVKAVRTPGWIPDSLGR